MKIAIVRKSYTPFGGAERYVDTLVQHLLKLGHEVHIFAQTWQCRSKNSSGHETRLFLHKIRSLNGPPALEILSFALNVEKRLKREHFDIIHSFERTRYQDIYRAGDGCHKEWLIQRAKYEPFWKTWSVRINPLHHTILWIEKQIFTPKNTSLVIFNSRRGKDEVIRHYHYPADRMVVIHNGVDRARFNPSNRQKYRMAVRESYGLSETDYVLLFLGSGFKRKGLAFALEALSQLVDPGVKMFVCGRDKPGRYHRLARNLRIENRIIFVGPTQEPERLYGASDLFILPTIYEPFSNACLEALSSGLPVVTTKINGVSDIIVENQNGRSVDDPSDIPSLAGAIRYFLPGNKGILPSDVAAGSYTSTEDHAKEIVSVYEKFVIR